MLDGVVIKTITREQYTNAGLRPVVARGHLIELNDCLPGFFWFSEFQISFREQVEILRLIRVFADLVGQLSEVQLRTVLTGKAGAVVHEVEKVLIRIGTQRSIFRESLKATQLPLGPVLVMGISLHRGRFVVPRGG